jgi:hypothetical protein
LLSPSILKTMKVNVYPQFIEGFYFIKKIENTTIINRVGHIKAHYMKVFIYQ